MALSLTSMVGGSLGCASLLGLWFVTKDSSSASHSPAGKSRSPSENGSDEDMSDDDEPPSAPQMPPEMRGEKLHLRSWLNGQICVC